MTMIERVARAIAGNDLQGQSRYDAAGEMGREQWRSDARHAIAAMRDPSPAVIDAAEEAIGNIPQGISIHSSDMHNAVIDAALVEGAA